MNDQRSQPMTLYLKLSPTPDTIVFSGDKRFIDELRFTDNNVKVTRLGGFSVGGATRTILRAASKPLHASERHAAAR
jgi:hypothetical protein